MAGRGPTEHTCSSMGAIQELLAGHTCLEGREHGPEALTGFLSLQLLTRVAVLVLGLTEPVILAASGFLAP